MIQSMENPPKMPVEIVGIDSLPADSIMLLPNRNPGNLSPQQMIDRGRAVVMRISDLRDPNDPQGRSYREVNAAKAHKYPIGALVEFNHGVRLWVVHHARDCDQTPLYCLSADPNDTQIEREGFFNASWVKGIAEQYLTFIRMVNAPETTDEPETNRSVPCPKGGKHSWIGDDAGDSWCEKCGEALLD